MSRADNNKEMKRVGEGCCPLTLGGQSLFLLSERAVYWSERQVLFVADLHLGKDATFRQAGLAVPAVSSRDSLTRLQTLIEAYEPAECIILGDLIHAADSLNERVHREISEFFERASGCRWRLIKGNHDRHTKKWPADWPLLIESEGVVMEPFRLLHVPEFPAGSSDSRTICEGIPLKKHEYFLAGHIHPAWRRSASLLVREKLACYWLTPHGLILPAFGTFTGTKAIESQSQDRVFVVADNRVIEVTSIPIQTDEGSCT